MPLSGGGKAIQQFRAVCAETGFDCPIIDSEEGYPAGRAGRGMATVPANRRGRSPQGGLGEQECQVAGGDSDGARRQEDGSRPLPRDFVGEGIRAPDGPADKEDDEKGGEEHQ